ncbi:MAG: glycosyltransferase [Thermoanaerobaculia bacterium]
MSAVPRGSLSSDVVLRELAGWQKTGSGKRTLPACSLVVATRGRAGRIQDLLGKLAVFDGAPSEVVIVDGSDDGETDQSLRQLAKGRQLPYTLTYVLSPAGLTRQRNVGVDVSAGEFLFFLDDDCVPQSGYFRALRDVLRAPENQRVGAVCGAIVNEMNRPLSWRWRIRIALTLVPKGKPGKYYPTATSLPRSMETPFTGVRPVDVLPGGASAYRREVFAGHRFSEFFQGYAQGEDVEMSRRIARDWVLLQCGDAPVVHDHAESGRPLGFKRGRMTVRNRTFIWKRHSPDVSLADRLRYWCDHVFSALYYAGVFVSRPRQLHNLLYAFGLLTGVVEYALAPPRYVEPAARREYGVDLEPLEDGAV